MEMTSLSPGIILALIGGYFLLLIGVSFLTSRKGDNEDFFIAGRKSPWFIVAFGMIGASLSGVTFISVPGWVADSQFGYMQVVFGYFFGYAFIALVLLPLYYRLQLTSIYTYLEKRFGFWSYKTGAAFFLLSRTIGASFRLYLVAIVLQKFVFDRLGLPFDIPFAITVALTIALIWVYTFRGGIRTIVWTDTLQTSFMLLAVIGTLAVIFNQVGFDTLMNKIELSGMTQVFHFENGWSDANNFFKQFLSGIFIAIVMTGLDQDMMQKNLSCKNLKEAQLNMFSFSTVLIFVNALFLLLGAALYVYMDVQGIPPVDRTDYLYPTLAIEHLGPVVGILFVLGLIAAAYSSADSALTSLTTSFCIDFLNFEKQENNTSTELTSATDGILDEDIIHQNEARNSAYVSNKLTRLFVHLGFSVLLLFVIVGFSLLPNDAIISQIFKAAGYTYGPLLGLYGFGLLFKRKVIDFLVPIICIFSPIIAFVINYVASNLGFEFGFLILLLNGGMTFLALLFISLFADQSKPAVA